MPAMFVPAFAFLFGVLAAMIASHMVFSREARRQLEIVKRGETAFGTVVSISRPRFAGVARVYFEFAPIGSELPVRCCHVDRRGPGEPTASLPAVGTRVNVRYLRENPRDAVIAKLVSRFVR